VSKLIVCGDSFMSPISCKEGYDTGCGLHFSELLSKKLGWELVSFARGACSNQTIRLQIDEAIKINPDYVIIASTSPDRFEFPIKNMKTKSYFEKYKLSFFEKINGLYNIDYNGFPDKSAEHIQFNINKPKMFSETLNNIFNNQTDQNYMTNLEIEILLKWFDRFYDMFWKKQQDAWIMADGLRRLMDNNINFGFICGTLDEEIFNFCSDRLINKKSQLNPATYQVNDTMYRFHTSLKSQEILCDLWFNHMNLKNNIKKKLI
jgi:hypothetical protein